MSDQYPAKALSVAPVAARIALTKELPGQGPASFALVYFIRYEHLMAEIFIIMQIGDNALDKMCEQAMVPAAETCGYAAKRVDKHNEGGLLKSEIINFIGRADIIIADLTNERPNCYLEIGYAMGLDKFRNLILTAREDHHPESPKFVPGGPKIHFDLAGYDILFWAPDKLGDFREELKKRIKRRSVRLAPASKAPLSPWNHDWIAAQQGAAMGKLLATGKAGFMEIRFALDAPKPDKKPQELNEAARSSPIETFGWPIAVYMRNVDEFLPKPRTDGIVAEIASDNRNSYDYWTIARNGDFYLLKTIFEDDRAPGKDFFQHPYCSGDGNAALLRPSL